MNEELKAQLLERGYLDEEEVYAVVKDAENAAKMLCASGEIITLVKADGKPDTDFKVFSDSSDKLTNIKISGLFAKRLDFDYNGTHYSFAVSGGKRLIEYFKLLAQRG